jgi:hypothetical protein
VAASDVPQITTRGETAQDLIIMKALHVLIVVTYMRVNSAQNLQRIENQEDTGGIVENK